MRAARRLIRNKSVVVRSDWRDASALQACLPTGILVLDKLLQGGIPKGHISEIVGSPSSGKTGLLLSILARAVARGEAVGYVDVFDSLDPHCAQERGIDLDRFLWVRCEGWPLRERVQRALKAMDILARSEGFAILVLDLEPTSIPQSAQVNPVDQIPFHTWFRLKRILRGKPTALVLLGRRPCCGSASSLVLGLDRSRVRWNLRGLVDDKRKKKGILLGVHSDVRLLRGKGHGHVQVYCGF